jgi:hypothetical protein
MRKGEENMNWSKSRRVFPTVSKIIHALIPAKRKRQAISSILAGLLFGSNAQAQTGDWRAVQDLNPGSRILVKSQHSYLCSVEGTTDEELVCEVQKRRSLGTSTIMIPRAEIREVRVLPNQAKEAWIGAGIGAGAGAIAAGAGSRTYKGANAFFGGLAGAGLGALVGAAVPVFQVIFRRSKLIYKQ